MIRAILTALALAFPAIAVADAADFYPNIPSAQARYAAYEASPDCTGPELDTLMDFIENRRIYSRAELVMDQLQGGTFGLDTATTLALAEIALAKLAWEKECTKVARDLLLGVIDTYQGEAFGAVRTHATIVIDDIRASQ